MQYQIQIEVKCPARDKDTGRNSFKTLRRLLALQRSCTQSVQERQLYIVERVNSATATRSLWRGAILARGEIAGQILIEAHAVAGLDAALFL